MPTTDEDGRSPLGPDASTLGYRGFDMLWLEDKRAFQATLGLGVTCILVFAVSPTGTAWQVGAWFTPQVASLALWWVRARSAPQSLHSLLTLLLAGQITYFGAGFIWFVSPSVLGYPLPFPSPVDALFFAAYGVFAGFLMRLLRRHRADRVSNRVALVDSLILTAAVSGVLWVEVISPQLGDSTRGIGVVVAVLYPVFTLLLFGLASRTALSMGLTRSAPALLLLAWIGCEVAADIFYGFQSANGTFTYDGPLMLVWLASYTALAALAAHPGVEAFLHGDAQRDAARATEPRRESATAGTLRVAVLLLAALFPLPLHALYHDNSSSLLVASGVMVVLVSCRTSLRAGDVGRQRHLSAELDHAVQRLSTQREELARYAAIVASTDDSVITASPDGLIMDWNQGAERLYGYTSADAMGTCLTTLCHRDFREDFPALLVLVAESGHASFECLDVRRDGSTVEISVTLSSIRDEAGEVLGLVSIARDISDRKARDAEIHQQSKLESLGRLSAGLAHEINSPIQFVGDNARFLEEAYEELIGVVTFYRGLLDTANPIGWAERQERMREAEAGIDFDYLQKEIPSAVEQTLEGIERVSRIVRAMKTFSHPGHEEQVPANLNEALEATITVTRHQVSSVADLHFDLANLPPGRCNIADLNQVFLNLIVNAADAIADTGNPGTIGVTTAVDDEHVVIRISDTGAGIPDDVRAKIFDPFFTTKDVGRGSGQGLPLARGVVHEGHGGTLAVDSTVGVGSTFTIRLPIDGRPERELSRAGA